MNQALFCLVQHKMKIKSKETIKLLTHLRTQTLAYKHTQSAGWNIFYLVILINHSWRNLSLYDFVKSEITNSILNLIKNQSTITIWMIVLNPHDQNGIETHNCSLTFVIQMGHGNTSKPRQKSTMFGNKTISPLHSDPDETRFVTSLRQDHYYIKAYLSVPY